MKFKNVILFEESICLLNESNSNTIGFYKIEHTPLSLTMALMDKFPGIKIERKPNDKSNPGFPVEEYPYMLKLKGGAKIEDVKKAHSEHFAKMKTSKDYANKYDLSKAYYRKNR